MNRRNNLPLVVFLITCLLVISACTSELNNEVAQIPEFATASPEVSAETPAPTATITPTPTSTATPTSAPTETPSPTPTPISPEFSNLVLALDYDPKTIEPLSPQDYFPLGVSYIAVIFDYMVPASTRLNWYIYGAGRRIEASGMTGLSSRDGRKAMIVQPQEGLDEGRYELRLELSGEVVLSREFEVFWNPTLWPISVSADPSTFGEHAVANAKFPLGTEFLFASFATINFAVGDELFAEWFVDGQKLGEHQYVWNNPDWSTGIHGVRIVNQIDVDASLPAGNYELLVYVNGVPKQCKAFQITGATTNEAVPGCETFEANQAISHSTPTGTWGRYEPRTFSELDALTGELLTELTEDKAIYLEMSPSYQYPSLITVVFTGNFRDTPELKLVGIKAWMATFAPNLSEADVASLFGQEGLFVEDNKEYWIPIQDLLIPIMEDELSVGDQVDLFVIWMGATIESDEIERIYLVNAFE